MHENQKSQQSHPVGHQEPQSAHYVENEGLPCPDKSPVKASSELGGLGTTQFFSSSNTQGNPDSISTQATQKLIAHKVTHKTPQIKPSDPGLAMTGISVPDNYSNDDKGAE